MNDLETIHRALAEMVHGQRPPAEILGIDPSIVNGLFALGIAAREKGRHSMADSIFQRCLFMNPFRGDFWIALAASRQSLGRPAEAGEMYQVAALCSSDPAPVAYAAACFAQAEQFDRAASLVTWLRGRPHDADALAPWLEMVDEACARHSAVGGGS